MSKVCYSPEGNPEMWITCPDNYMSEEDWKIIQDAKEKEAHDEAERIRLLPENLRTSIIADINSGFTRAVDSFLSEYPAEESSLLFDRQAADVAVYHNTGDISDFLINLATTRMITIDELIAKIEKRKVRYDKIMATLLGMRYYYLDALASLETTEQLLDLDISYKLAAEEI